MNNMVCHPAESEPAIRCMTVETTALEDLYSTTPLKIIGSLYRQPDEDELHSAFEEAISERVFAFQKQRLTISNQSIDSVSSLPSIQTDVSLPVRATEHPVLSHGKQVIILLMAIAFMLLLIGFDLMGLLILLTS
jgi:hypothetical protein